MGRIKVLRQLNGKHREEIKDLERICNSFDNTNHNVFLSSGRSMKNGMRNFYLHYEKDLTGFLLLSMTEEGETEIYSFVHPGNRRRGIYTRLLKEASLECREYGIKELLFVHNPKNCLEKHGLNSLTHELLYSEYRMEYLLARIAGKKKEEEKFAPQLSSMSIISMQESKKEAYENLLRTLFHMDDLSVKDRMKEIQKDPNIKTYLAVKEDEVIGCFSLYVGKKAVTLFDFGISESIQKKGYGHALLLQVYQRITELVGKHEKMILQVNSRNEAALHLYEKFGFRISEQLDFYRVSVPEQ